MVRDDSDESKAIKSASDPEFKGKKDSRKAEKRKELGRVLRQAYQEVLTEPIPDQFAELLEQLDKATSEADPPVNSETHRDQSDPVDNGVDRKRDRSTR